MQVRVIVVVVRDKAHLGIAVHVVGQYRRHHVTTEQKWQEYPQVALRLHMQPLGRGFGGVHRRQQPHAVGQVGAARAGQADAPRTALKQRHPQPRLQPGNRAHQGRARHLGTARCCRQARLPGQRGEQLHIAITLHQPRRFIAGFSAASWPRRWERKSTKVLILAGTRALFWNTTWIGNGAGSKSCSTISNSPAVTDAAT